MCKQKRKQLLTCGNLLYRHGLDFFVKDVIYFKENIQSCCRSRRLAVRIRPWVWPESNYDSSGLSEAEKMKKMRVDKCHDTTIISMFIMEYICFPITNHGVDFSNKHDAPSKRETQFSMWQNPEDLAAQQPWLLWLLSHMTILTSATLPSSWGYPNRWIWMDGFCTVEDPINQNGWVEWPWGSSKWMVDLC